MDETRNRFDQPTNFDDSTSRRSSSFPNETSGDPIVEAELATENVSAGSSSRNDSNENVSNGSDIRKEWNAGSTETARNENIANGAKKVDASASESSRSRPFIDPQPIPPRPDSPNFNASAKNSASFRTPPNGFPPYPPFPPPYWATQQEPPSRSNGCGSVFFRFFSAIFGVLFGGFCFFFLASFMLAGLIAFFIGDVSLDSDSVVEKTLSGSELCSHKIAVLPIEGTILGEEDGFIRNAIRQAYEDDRIVALVLRINSPGGTMSGSDYYYHQLTTLKNERNIPIIVSMGDMAASGGYYLAATGDKIFAERSTWTGSIGVICPLYNAAGLCEKVGVSSNAITSGSMKGMGDMTKPMSDEERQIWQNLVDESYRQFLDVVRKGRPQFADGDNAAEDDPLRKIADGRVYSAEQAKELGLIDEIDFLDAAVEEAIQRSGVSQDDVQIVRYIEEESFFDSLNVKSNATSDKIAGILSAATAPKVYYLCPQAIPTSL